MNENLEFFEKIYGQKSWFDTREGIKNVVI